MPFTADDFLFWYEDVALNPDIFPSPPPEMVIAGEPGLMEKDRRLYDLLHLQGAVSSLP